MGDIDEQIQDYIAFCDKEIKIYKGLLKKDKDNIIVKLYLLNFIDKKESLLNTEVIPTKRWNDITREHKKGELIICGSDICYSVYPNEIKKVVIKCSRRKAE